MTTPAVNPHEAPFGYFPGTNIPRKAPARDEFDGKGVCRHCGQTGLVWEQTGQGWRLFTLGGTQHQCPKGTR
jgi:hypothetical protein